MEDDPFALVEAMTIAALRHRLRAGLSSTCAASTRWRIDGSSTRSTRRAQRGFLGRRHPGRGLRASTSRCGGAPAPTSAARRPRSSTRSRASAGEPRNKPPFPVESRPLRQADGRQQRRDPRQRARDRARRRARVRADRHRGVDRARSCSASPATSSGRASTRCRSARRSRELIELAGGVAGGHALAGDPARRRGGQRSCGPTSSTLPLTFEGARAAGATLGSGVVMVFDDTVDLPQILLRIAALLPRRVLRAVRALPGRHRAPGGGARPARRGRAARRLDASSRCSTRSGRRMRDASICGLGQTASSAVESAIRRLGVFEE